MDICYRDLENLRDARRLEQPMDALRGLEGLVVIDEVQCRPPMGAYALDSRRKSDALTLDNTVS